MTAIYFIATPEPMIRSMIVSRPSLFGCRPYLYDADVELLCVRPREEFIDIETYTLSDLDRIMKGHIYTFDRGSGYLLSYKKCGRGYYKKRMREFMMFIEFLKRHVDEFGEIFYTWQRMGEQSYADSVEIRKMHIGDLRYGPGVDEFSFDIDVIYHFVKG